MDFFSIVQKTGAYGSVLFDARGRTQGTFSNETAQTRWVDFEEARVLINLTQDSRGVSRDPKILDAAQATMARLKPARPRRTAPVARGGRTKSC